MMKVIKAPLLSSETEVEVFLNNMISQGWFFVAEIDYAQRWVFEQRP